jgi:fatty acid desaturase
MTATQADLLMPFHKVSNFRGACDLLCIYGAAFGLAAFASHWQNPIVSLLAIILIGGLQNGLVSLQHDAWHHLCFRPLKVNDFICSWLTGYAVGASYHFNQVRHSGHHAYFGTARDPDRVTFINDGKETPTQVVRYFVYILCGGTIVERVRLIIAKDKDKSLPGMDLRPKHMPSPAAELFCIALAQCVLMALFSLTGNWWNYWVYWLLPLVTVAAFLTTSRQFIEHANPADDPSPEDRLYDFDANLVEQFFFSPAHFHHHAFHHAYPKIPHYSLGKAKEHAKSNGLKYTCRLRLGYTAAFVEHMQGLRGAQGKLETNQ